MMNLLTLNFWFNSRPDYFTKGGQIGMIAIIVILFVSGVVCIFLAKKQPAMRRFYSSISSLGITNGFIGLLLLFLAYELIPVLSSRFWLIIWLAEMAFWKFMILRAQKKISTLKQLSQREQEIKKYIP